MTEKAKYKKGDIVWIGYNQASTEKRVHADYWEWKQVKIINFNPEGEDGGEYKVQIDLEEKDGEIRTLTGKELKNWQNLKSMQ